jgi:uncharacterized protein YciI
MMKTNNPLLAVLAPMLAAACLQAQAQTPARDVRHVIVHTPGPAWVAGKPPFEQPGIEAHIAHYRQLQQQGKLALGGPFLDGAGGGMMIAEPGVPESELAAFAQADPAVKSGLLRAELRPWLIGMRK